MYPAWIDVQIEKLALKHSKDLGSDKAIAMAHCWANKWILGASYPGLVHEIIDNWEEPAHPEWKNDWPEEKLDDSDTLDSSCEDILPKNMHFKILSHKRKDIPWGATSTSKPPPPPTTPPLEQYAPVTPPSHVQCLSKSKNDKIPKKKRSGKKNRKRKKKPSTPVTQPILLSRKEHNSSQSVTPEKGCHPVTTCYFFAQKLRKELTFKELDGSSASGSPINERRTVLYLEKRRLCEAKGGKKKARRLECATQAIPTLSKLLAEKSKFTNKRGKSRKPKQFPSDEKVYQDDCELMRELDIKEKPSRIMDIEWPVECQDMKTKKQKPRAEACRPGRRKQKRIKAWNRRASIDLLHAWAKHSKMKLKFLQNKEHSKLKLGEEIKVSVWLNGNKIGQGVHVLGDTYQAKLSAAFDAVTWLEGQSESFVEFKNSRNAKLMGGRGRTRTKQGTPKAAKGGKKSQKLSPKKVESLSLGSGSSSKKKSPSAQNNNTATQKKRAKWKERCRAKKDSPKSRRGSGKKGGSPTNRRNQSSGDLGSILTQEGKLNEPMKSPKKDKPYYRGGDL